MIQVEGIFSGGSDISAPIIGRDFNWTGGDGTYQVLEDGEATGASSSCHPVRLPR